jgi:hypothetical protein
MYLILSASAPAGEREFEIVVIVLGAPTNRLEDLRPLMPKLLEALPTAKRGEANCVSVKDP